MKEDLLHYIWKAKSFNLRDLKTTNGDALEIIDFGNHNFDAGPDFLNAKVKIGDKIWSGHIEIHIKSSDWYNHKHEQDSNYNPVVLHVVYDANKTVENNQNATIPQLELKSRIDHSLIDKYKSLNENQLWIPCQNHIEQVDSFKINMVLQKMTIERIANKTKALESKLENCHGSWEQLFFQELAKSFGLKVNADSFEKLATSTNIDIIRKYKGSLLQIESLLYGQSGLLPDHSDNPEINAYVKEYAFLKHKHQLEGISANYWKFLRLRPPNFPTIRLAQLAYLFAHSDIYFNELLEMNVETLIDNFKNIKTSDFWLDRYTFDNTSIEKKKNLGKDRVDLILINAIVPVLFFYGKKTAQEKFCDQAILILEKVKSEKNSIIQAWKKLGVESKSAFDSQGLIQLKKNYCDLKRCTHCSIGHTILKSI